MNRPPATPVLILGAGGHGSEIGSYLKDLIAREEPVRLAGFIDENKPAGPFCGSKILGGFGALRQLLRAHPKTRFRYITATGDNRARQSLVKKIGQLKARNLSPWTLRHPENSTGDAVRIGEGVCLAPRSTLTTRIRLGSHGILNIHASVSHDCVIGNFVNINPHAAICGNVKIGDGCSIGAGATVIENVSIGAWTIVGAGAVVTRDLPAHVTAVGVPARVIKKHSR